MKQPLIQTDEYLLLISEENIKDVKPHKGKYHLEKGHIINKFQTYLTDLSECKLILAHLPLTKEAPILEGVMLLPFVVNQYDELILKQLDFIHEAVRNKYFDLGFKTGALAMCMKNEKTPKFFTAEMELLGFQTEKLDGNTITWQPIAGIDYTPKPKTTTNEQGQLVIVGTYSIE